MLDDLKDIFYLDILSMIHIFVTISKYLNVHSILFTESIKLLYVNSKSSKMLEQYGK